MAHRSESRLSHRSFVCMRDGVLCVRRSEQLSQVLSPLPLQGICVRLSDVRGSSYVADVWAAALWTWISQAGEQAP